jgi:NADH:ubiquinone oxidoreductase subunit F (NADH-binding)/NADH:ubiquinone oxidoreductase subunit E
VPYDDARAGAPGDVPRRDNRGVRPVPKGRQVDPVALAEIRSLLAGRLRARDLLIEHLHLINDRHGVLALGHLAALAHEMRLSYAEVYEVASFYAHFRIVETPGAEDGLPVVRVCDGIACMMAGAAGREAELRAALAGHARVEPAPCIGACAQAPAAVVGFRTLPRIDVAALAEAVVPAVSDAEADAALTAYRAAGGLAQLAACRDGGTLPAAVFDALDAAGMRGLGGAGFPTGRKWRLVAAQPAPRLMAVNADEGEPGTFKDRWFLEQHAHRVLEGALIGAAAVGCSTIYVYVRDEYPEARATLAGAIGAFDRAGLLGGVRVELRRGAGAYVCGEESAMLESIEGRRGQPRHKPPFPAERGLFERPTLINNVETLWWVPEILARGGAWFAAQGRRGGKGLRAFSLSGRVREPGVKIAPAGITARELIHEFGGGMLPGHELLGYLPGGASGGILPASLADEPLDFGRLEALGCFVGSGAVVVLSDQDDLRAVARNLVRFFQHESCGKCTPCRVGTEKATGLIAGENWNRPLLEELSRVMADASICGLGQAAMNPVLSLFRHFPEALR